MGLNGRLALVLLTFIGAGIFLLASFDSAQGEPLSLEQAINIAIENNLSVILRDAEADRAKWDRLESWGAALPSLGIGARYSFSKTYGLRFIDLGDTAYYGLDPGSKRYSTGIDAQMTLFDGGYTWFRIKQSNQYKHAADLNLQNTINTTAYDVKIGYYTLLREIMLKTVQQDALARSKKQLEVTSSRYDLGSASLSEKLKAQVTVANDSLSVIQSENRIRAAEFSLNLVMNRDESIRITPTDSLRSEEMVSNVDELLQSSLKNNPSLLQSKAEMDAAATGVWMSRRSWFPNVNASMSWGWSPTMGDDWFSFKNDDKSYTFGISIGYDIFDGFAKKTTVSKAKLSAMTARETYDNAVKTLSSQVRQAYLDYEQSRLQLEVANLATMSAEEDMKLQQERYRLGASSILELLDAQVSLTTAQSNRVQAFYAVNKAIADLSKAMGER